jgi:hypothetical protein
VTSGAPRRHAAGIYLWLAGLGVIAAGRALGNGFAFDDVPMIAENAQVQSLAPPWVYAQQSYWPPKNLGDAYRPWTVWWFAIQWALGDGAPWVFHLGNLVLTLAVIGLVYRLLAEWLPPIGAAAGAAIFAVHPVHVEANANVVGQGELWMVGFVTAGILWYLRARRRGVWSGADRLIIALCLVLAAASKEQGIVLPGLLIAIEWCLPDDEPWTRRLRRLAPLYGLLAIVGLGFLAGRYAVLGDMGGGPPAAGLEGLSLAERARVMLPLAADWARLLVWPRDLLAQYSPPAFGLPDGFGRAELLGAGLLLGAVGALLARRRHPWLALGIAWILIGLLPVSNLLFPTGVLIAERTLYLPSVGIAVMAGALVAWSAADRRRLGATIALTVAVVAAGAARSRSRQPVWRDSPTLFAQTIVDAPRSYRGYLVRAKEVARRDAPDEAARMYQHAAALYEGDPRVFEEWGQLERAAGRCDQAIPIFARGLGHHPRATVLRSRLFECLLTVSDTTGAVEVAEIGLGLGMTEFTAPLARATRGRAAPPGPPPATPQTDR